MVQWLELSVSTAGGLDSIPGLGRSLEKEMAAHSNVAALEIPWTEEPGRLRPCGRQRVGHNLETKWQPTKWLVLTSRSKCDDF